METTDTSHMTASEAQRGSYKVLLAAALIAAVFLLSFTGLMWKLGFLTFTGTDSSAKIVAAAITLVGTLVGTLITFLGLFLKHSIDQRNIALREQTEARERIASERSNRLAEEAERRLGVETAIQAMGLLSSSGRDVPNTQRAGVILTLADLGMLELGLSLVDQMLHESKIDAHTTGWLLNKALGSGELNVQREAALLMHRHLPQMLSDNGGARCPPILLSDAYFELPYEIRLNGVFLLIDLITLRPHAEWDEGVYFTVVDFVYQIWEKDSAEDIKGIAGAASAVFLETYRPFPQIFLASRPRETQEVITGLSGYDSSYLWGRHPTGAERVEVFAQWASLANPVKPS